MDGPAEASSVGWWWRASGCVRNVIPADPMRVGRKVKQRDTVLHSARVRLKRVRSRHRTTVNQHRGSDMTQSMRFVLAAVLVVATMGLAAGCSGDSGTGGSLVTTTAASGGDSGSDSGTDSTEAPTTTKAPDTTTKAPDTTQAASGGDTSSETSTSSDDSSNTTIWLIVIAGIVIVGIIAFVVGRGGSTTTTTETMPPAPGPAPVDSGDASDDSADGETGG